MPTYLSNFVSEKGYQMISQNIQLIFPPNQKYNNNNK